MYSKTDINRFNTETDIIRRRVQLQLKENPSEVIPLIGSSVAKKFNGAANKDYKEVVNINQELVENLFSEKKVDYAIVYLWSVFLTRGFGFHDRFELLHYLAILSNISYKRLLQIEEELIEDKWWSHHNNRIYITSYRRVTTIHEIKSRASVKIPIELLFNKDNFIRHIISLTHLKLQNRFRYFYKEMWWNGQSTVSQIDSNQYPSRKEKVGCSIRKVAEHLQLSYKYCWNYLQGSLKREYNLVEDLSVEEFDKKYDLAFFKEFPKYSYRYIEGRMKIFVALGSTNVYEMSEYLIKFGKSHLCSPFGGDTNIDYKVCNNTLNVKELGNLSSNG